VGFVVDKAALGQVFSEYFGFHCQSFHRSLHYHNHPGLISDRSVEWTLIPPPTMQIKKKLYKSIRWLFEDNSLLHKYTDIEFIFGSNPCIYRNVCSYGFLKINQWHTGEHYTYFISPFNCRYLMICCEHCECI
jgi:hypothetical protein